MAITLCFSKFWRMRRAEKVRKERKQEEEEEDFMRMMGIDPNGPLYSDSESSETEDEDESDEEEEQQPLNQQVFASPKTQIITLPPNQPQAHVVQRYVVPAGGQVVQGQVVGGQQVQGQQAAPRVVGNRIYL